ncbi:MAG: PocR ligand-binding domain-containing protein [Clostridia bacterium]|nr:PocR ligand-binding domain-containing protein [Clostridia bacterium]
MKKQEIVSVLSELHKITGFRVSLHGADYSEIAAYPEKKSEFCRRVHELPEEYRACVACDKEACREALAKRDTHIYKCRYGFTEAVSPLYNFGTLTGFLMMGQVFEEGDRARSFPLSDKLDACLCDIPSVRSDMIRSYVKIMTICAQYLTLSNAIPNEKPTVAEMVKRFIHENFSEKIGIAEICREVGCSKSTLITCFKRAYGTTVNKYLTDVRLGEALRMLRGGDMSIGEIAEATGFSDQSYFSKVFSSKYGFPPSEYAARTADSHGLQ